MAENKELVPYGLSYNNLLYTNVRALFWVQAGATRPFAFAGQEEGGQSRKHIRTSLFPPHTLFS